MKHCKECETELVEGENISPSMLKNYDYVCHPCRKQRKRDSYRRNKEGYIRRASKWRSQNKHRVAEFSANRRARVRNQTPDMNAAEKAEIQSMYLYNQIMPGKWHVDHVDPIDNGGLHHPENLQILSEHDNCSKGHRV